MRFGVALFQFIVGVLFGVLLAVGLILTFSLLNEIESAGQQILISALAFGAAGCWIYLSNLHDDTWEYTIPRSAGMVLGCVLPVFYAFTIGIVRENLSISLLWPTQIYDVIIAIAAIFVGFNVAKQTHLRLTKDKDRQAKPADG
jgi:hypothetical protein